MGRQSEPLIMSTGLATCRVSSFNLWITKAVQGSVNWPREAGHDTSGVETIHPRVKFIEGEQIDGLLMT